MLVIPQVTCDLPAHPVTTKHNWKRLKLADPEYNKPGRIDILLGVEVFLKVLRQARWCGPPTAINTEFEVGTGWKCRSHNGGFHGGDSRSLNPEWR
jgi:hypothetical protein